MSERVLEALEQTWASIDDLCSQLDVADWRTQTDCPGWSVQDCLAHICAVESKWLGRRLPPPMPLESRPEHVRNELGAINEAAIDMRRSRAPEEVLSEFLEVTTARLKVLGDLGKAEWDAETDGVFGKAPLREVIAIRVLDCYYHEQDIRRAVDRAGHLVGDAPSFVYERMRAAMPFVVAKKASAPDGSTVVFDITAPDDRFTVEVSGGRGSIADKTPASATGTIRADSETFLCLAGGRRSPDYWLEAGRAEITGEQALARAILDQMAVTP